MTTQEDFYPYLSLALFTVLYTARDALKNKDLDSLNFIKSARLEKYMESIGMENRYVGRTKLVDIIRSANLRKINKMIRILRSEDGTE